MKSYSKVFFTLIPLAFLLNVKVSSQEIIFGYSNSGNLVHKQISATLASATLQAPTQVCPNEPAQLNASGGISYQWSTGHTGATLTLSNPAAGLYTVTVTNSEGCSVVLEHMLQVYNQPDELEITGDIIALAEPNAQYRAYFVHQNEGSFYDWTVEGGMIISGYGTAQVLVHWTGDYEGQLSVQETNANGCQTGVAVLEVQLEKRQQIPLGTGWNLMSFNVAHRQSHVPMAYGSIMPVMERVKDEFSVFFVGQNPVFNTLDTVTNGQGYWVKVTQPTTLTAQGLALQPETVAIPLLAAPNWNLIGYPVQSAQPIEEALSSIWPHVRIVKTASQTYNSSYPPVFNNLSEMRPGQGCWIQVDQEMTLYYTRPNNFYPGGEIGSRGDDLPEDWQTVVYPNSMTAVGLVTMDGEVVRDGTIGVFVGEECRAIADINVFWDSSWVTLVMNGIEAEPLTFKLYQDEQEYISVYSDTLRAGTDQKLDYLLLEFFSPLSSQEDLIEKWQFQVRPNPASEVVQISFALPASDRTSLQLYDAQGKLVRTLIKEGIYPVGVHTQEFAPNLPAGVYLVRLQIGNAVATKRLILSSQ